jgi:hypothetical protein
MIFTYSLLQFCFDVKRILVECRDLDGIARYWRKRLAG